MFSGEIQLAAFNLLAIAVVKITALTLGYLCVRRGGLLIEAGAKGQFKFSAEIHNFKTSLASVSPGLLFVLLGVLLMGYAVGVDKPVSVNSPAQVSKPPVVRLPHLSEGH